MDFIRRLAANKTSRTVFLFCLIFFLLRFPSLFEPNWYGDEGIYQNIGYGLRMGKRVYTEVWDNKPPMLFVIYALAYGDQFSARLLSLVFGLGAVIVFYALSANIFKEKKIRIFTTFFFTLLFGLPMIEGNIANSENFMLFPILLSAYLVYTADGSGNTQKGGKRKQFFLAGLILCFSFLIKIVSIFDFAAFLTYLFLLFNGLTHTKIKTVLSRLPKFILSVSPFLAGFILPVALTFPFFYFLGVLPYYLDAAFGRNVGYVGYANYFIIPQGILYVRVLLLFSVLCVLFLKRHKFSKEVLFIATWLAFSLFNAYFSNRPYTHYLLLLLPGFSLFSGLLFRKYLLQYRMFLIAVTGILLLFVSNHFHFWGIARTIQYYGNFTGFITGKKSFPEYQSFFDERNVSDYAIAAYIKRHTEPGDTVFLWGNSAQIYPLSQTLPPGRYSTSYHMQTNIQTMYETEAALRKNIPKYIIITPDEDTFPFDLSSYRYVITIEDTHIYERTL